MFAYGEPQPPSIPDTVQAFRALYVAPEIKRNPTYGNEHPEKALSDRLQPRRGKIIIPQRQHSVKCFLKIYGIAKSIRNTPDIVGKLKNIPVRAFVGSADTIVPPDSSKEVIAALKAAGGSAEITVFDGADHFSVPSLTFLDTNIDLIGWLIGG